MGFIPCENRIEEGDLVKLTEEIRVFNGIFTKGSILRVKGRGERGYDLCDNALNCITEVNGSKIEKLSEKSKAKFEDMYWVLDTFSKPDMLEFLSTDDVETILSEPSSISGFILTMASALYHKRSDIFETLGFRRVENSYDPNAAKCILLDTAPNSLKFYLISPKELFILRAEGEKDSEYTIWSILAGEESQFISKDPEVQAKWKSIINYLKTSLVVIN